MARISPCAWCGYGFRPPAWPCTEPRDRQKIPQSWHPNPNGRTKTSAYFGIDPDRAPGITLHQVSLPLQAHNTKNKVASTTHCFLKKPNKAATVCFLLEGHKTTVLFRTRSNYAKSTYYNYLCKVLGSIMFNQQQHAYCPKPRQTLPETPATNHSFQILVEAAHCFLPTTLRQRTCFFKPRKPCSHAKTNIPYALDSNQLLE